jgi:glycerol-3-phosphate responsive antiterminator
MRFKQITDSLKNLKIMKTTMLNLSFLAGFTLLISSCGKTYVCQCTGPDGTNTTTGQVKAYSKKKAEKLCSATCSGGTSSAK